MAASLCKQRWFISLILCCMLLTVFNVLLSGSIWQHAESYDPLDGLVCTPSETEKSIDSGIHSWPLKGSQLSKLCQYSLQLNATIAPRFILTNYNGMTSMILLYRHHLISTLWSVGRDPEIQIIRDPEITGNWDIVCGPFMSTFRGFIPYFFWWIHRQKFQFWTVAPSSTNQRYQCLWTESE